MTSVVLVLFALAAQSPSPSAEELLDAARRGDRARVTTLLDAGVDVNAASRYRVTALGFAADRGDLDLVRLLVSRGADVNVQDSFYGFRAIDRALGNGHTAVALLLLERGSKGAASVLSAGIARRDQALVKAALASDDLDSRALAAASTRATQAGDPVIAEMVRAAAAARPLPPVQTVALPPDVLQRYVGSYRNEAAAVAVTVKLDGKQLLVEAPGQPALALTPTSETTFDAASAPNVTVAFRGRGGMVESMLFTTPGGSTAFERLANAPLDEARGKERASAPTSGSASASTGEAPSAPISQAPRPWPSFRGPNAAGHSDGQGAVDDWDAADGRNIRWKTPIPGIATSSPIVHGNRVFVTTAVSSAADATFRTGNYGDVKPVDDLSPHTWKVYALDRGTGKVVWARDVFTGAPRVKRHTKSSQASSTPVTDGTHVVSVFGSIGLLICHDVDGTERWRKDIGVIDNGWFFDPAYQWGHSSSPIIHKDLVILQADQQKGSYLAAFELATGRERWRAARDDEISTWATPTIVRGTSGDEVVTNGTKVRGYDPSTGKLLWTLGPNSEITVGTPVAGEGIVYVTGGYPPVRPIYAIRAGGSGDISLPKDAASSAAIAWSNTEGTYIPTPLLYRGQLYTMSNNGVLTAYDAASGTRLYRARVGGGGSFAASPVAADGRLYIASEDGDVFVVSAGPEYAEIAKRPMNEVIMATPAISGGLLVIRTLGHVYGIGR